MVEQFKGKVEILDTANNATIELNGNTAELSVGGGGKGGTMQLRDDAGKTRIFLNGKNGNMYVRDDAQKNLFLFHGDISEIARLTAGGVSRNGQVVVRNKTGDVNFLANPDSIFVSRKVGTSLRSMLYFDASPGSARLFIGCEGNEGHIIVNDGAGRSVFHFDGASAALHVGAAGSGYGGQVIIDDGAGNERIRLDGGSGDIRLQGADCAEEFDVAETGMIDPGTVLVIDHESRLRACNEPYDKKVAGVVSGGNGSNPAIILDKNPSKDKRLPVALNGKVYCKVDAEISPVEVGDLLTTSSTPGHAMKADDPSKAFGAVIGKALCPLREGKGLIPILAALQ